MTDQSAIDKPADTAVAIAEDHQAAKLAKLPLQTSGAIQPIVPQTLEEVFRYAQLVVRAGLAPSSYEYDKGVMDANNRQMVGADPEKIMIGILKGMEINVPPMTALSNIAIVNKRPCIWGDLAIALIQSKNLVERTEAVFEGGMESAAAPTEGPDGSKDHTPTIADFADSMVAIYRIWRRGQSSPYEGRFSVRDAKRARLWANAHKQPWMLYPKRMLMNRARAFALRDGFADALAGLAIREEVEDLPPAPVKADTSYLDDNLPEPKDAA